MYSKLDPMDLAVIGGRNGDIGVGGLPLGGMMERKPEGLCKLTLTRWHLILLWLPRLGL